MLKNLSLHRYGFGRFMLALFTVLLLAAPAVAADEGELTFDRWYVLRLQGERIGHAHMSMRESDERVITSNETHMSIRRGQATMHIAQTTRFTETRDGKPIEARSRMKLGQMAVNKTMRFGEDEHELISEQGGRETRQPVPASEEAWLPPAAAQRYIEQRMDEGAERIELRTFDLSMGAEPFEMMLAVLGEEAVEVMGKVVPATMWRAEMSSMPGVTATEYVDRQGQTLKTTVQVMPGMEVEMLAADEQVATAEVDPPEMLASMLVEPAGAIDAPRELRRAVYQLRLDDSVDPQRFKLPRTGYQRIVWGDQRTAKVVTDLDQPVPAGEDLPGDAHRAASSMIDHDDPKVRALLKEALGADGEDLDEFAKAKRLRAFVQRYVNEKDLSVGLATASEVARTRQGDCTEHAVLLTALLRAADIPSRTATGLLYVDQFLGREGVFGGHMWTQAWLPTQTDGGHTWIDLDATLPQQAYDAAHITLAVSAMDDAAPTNALLEQLPLMQAMEIEIVHP
ncbi:MAG: transglutaminase-like domain-containing protein [Phycisphaeraceae bacterium]